MNNYLKNFITSFFLLACLVPFSNAERIIHYKNEPVTINLNVGEERTIQFGDHVQVGVTKGQQVKKLFRVQSTQGAVFVLPYKEFEKQRVQIKRLTDGQVILVDFIASKTKRKNKELEKIRIVLPSDNVIDSPQVMPVEQTDVAVITPVDLTRYASQRLYGPSRLYKDVMGINESSLGVKTAIRLFNGENKYRTYAKPIIAYQGGGHYLSAIHIKNVSEKDTTLDYLEINLPFSHATFQHHSLSPNGEPGDSTVLYLVSDMPLKETLYPWTYYADAQAEAEELVRAEIARKKAEAAKRKRLKRDR